MIFSDFNIKSYKIYEPAISNLLKLFRQGAINIFTVVEPLLITFELKLILASMADNRAVVVAVRDIPLEYGVLFPMHSREEVLDFANKLRTDEEFRKLLVNQFVIFIMKM